MSGPYSTWDTTEPSDLPDGRPDTRIVPLVNYLRDRGIVTLQSCSGHYEGAKATHDGHLCFAPSTLPQALRELRGYPFSRVRETFWPEPWFELWWEPSNFGPVERVIRGMIDADVELSEEDLDTLVQNGALAADLVAIFFEGTGAELSRATVKRALECLIGNGYIKPRPRETWPEFTVIDPPYALPVGEEHDGRT